MVLVLIVLFSVCVCVLFFCLLLFRCVLTFVGNHKSKQDDILDELSSALDVKQSLDEISREVDELKSKLTNGDSGAGENNAGQQTHAVGGEIDKIRKIVEILETVVLPIVVDSQNKDQKPNPLKGAGPAAVASVASVASDPIKIIPKGLRLLQHHSGLIPDFDDGHSTIEKIILQTNDK